MQNAGKWDLIINALRNYINREHILFWVLRYTENLEEQRLLSGVLRTFSMLLHQIFKFQKEDWKRGVVSQCLSLLNLNSCNPELSLPSWENMLMCSSYLVYHFLYTINFLILIYCSFKQEAVFCILFQQGIIIFWNIKMFAMNVPYSYFEDV